MCEIYTLCHTVAKNETDYSVNTLMIGYKLCLESHLRSAKEWGDENQEGNKGGIPGCGHGNAFPSGNQVDPERDHDAG
ncbi:MAG: hypothetical protein Q7T28_05965 [Cypionkella sp.]|nr:hypothetical protein [Cypionkella sp.]